LAKSTWCEPSEQVDFALANGLEATADFDGGDISPFGGLVLLAAVDDANHFIAGAARCIKDKREQSRVTHSIEDLLKQIVYLICAGYPNGINSNFFRKDPMLKLITGWMPNGEQHAAAQASISRIMTGRSKQDCLRLFSYFISSYINNHEKTPEKIELDFDGAAVEAHGRQQFIAFNGHYECNMYFPLFVLDQHQRLIAPILRPGNVSDAAITVDVLKILVKRLRCAWPHVKIMFRGDAGFHDPEIMDWCEANSVDYVIGLKGDHALNIASKQFDTGAEKAFAKQYGPQMFAGPSDGKKRHELLREISAQPKVDRRNAYAILDERQIRKLGEFRHRAGDGMGRNDKRRQKHQWKQERRVISLARVSDRGLKRRYLVTSLEGYTPEVIYDEIYALRGKTAELSIRSIKSLGVNRLNSQEALTNQFALLLKGLAYNLFQLVREQLPAALKTLSIETLMYEFVRIAVQVKVSTRRIWLHWSSCYPLKKPVLKLCKRLNCQPKPA
jgi:hypothetical protein